MGKLATSTKGTAIQPNNAPATVQDMIKSNWGRIAAVAPKHLNQERMLQIAISTLNKNPKLAECTPISLLSALMTCSALGLEPSDVDGLGRAYIIPFENKRNHTTTATFILGYKGMIDLARRSGELLSIIARAVYAGDFFDYSFGTKEHIEHIPTAVTRTPENLTHVYLVAMLKDGGQHIDVMTKNQVEAHRKRSKSANEGPWVTDYEAMAAKTIIRANFKYLPVSIEAVQAVESDGTTGAYTAQIDPDYPVLDIEAVEQDEAPQEPPTQAEQADFVAVYCSSCGAVRQLTADVTPADLEVIACDECGKESVLRFADERG